MLITVRQSQADRPPNEPFTDEYFQNPYLTYAWLRARHPVYRTPLPLGDGHVWLLSRYEDVRSALADPRFSSSVERAGEGIRNSGLAYGAGGALERSLSKTDPPDHTRLRTLATKALTVRRMEAWRKPVQRIADRLLDELDPNSPLDVLSDFGSPFAMTVLCEVLGIPLADHSMVRRWAEVMSSAEPAERKQIPEAMGELERRATELIAMKRAHQSEDLLSDLVFARDAGNQLSEIELLAMLEGLIVAGHKTSVDLIGNGLLALFDHPAQKELLQSRPQLIEPAVEEFLRYDGPTANSLWRFTTETVRVDGVDIPPGETVLLLLASANRDPRKFSDPDSLDIGRINPSHLGFGHGVHRCLGAALGRLNGRVALSTLLDRFPTIQLAVPRSSIRYRKSILLRSLEELPVRLQA